MSAVAEMSIMDSACAAQGGIRVKRETIIIMSDRNDDDIEVRDASPSVIIKSGETDTQVQHYCRPKTFRKLSNASSLISEIFKHPDTSEELLRRKIKRANDRDTSRELIEFLRNTEPPPPQNMSVVGEQGGEQKKRRRVSFWSFLRRKGGKAQTDVRQEPPLIQLPDSAVVGKTTGGYRHIAISIPIEYAHLDGIRGAKNQKEMEPASAARNEGEPTPPAPARPRLPVTVLKPVAEMKDAAVPPSGLLPLIPPLSNETFSSLLTPDETLESMSSYSESRQDGFTCSEADDGSVGHHSPLFVASSPPLTAKVSVSSLFSLTGNSPRLHHPRRRLSNLRPPPPVRGQSSIAESILTNGTEPVVSDATTARGYASPRLVAVEPTRQSDQESTGTDNDTAVHSAEFDLGPSAGELEDTIPQSLLGKSDRSACLRACKLSSYDPYEPYSQPRYLTPTCFPHRPSMLSLSPIRNEYMYDSDNMDTYLSKPGMACPFCCTPIMVVADYVPSSPQPTPEVLPGFVTARESVASTDSFSLSDLRAPEDSTIDITPCAASTPKASHPPNLHACRSFNLSSLHATPSIEHMLLTRRHSFHPCLSSDDHRQHHLYRRSTQQLHHSSRSQRYLSRSNSHRDLIRRYEDLCVRRERELDMLLNRLEKLESNNDRWLQAMVPIFENLTRGLLATQGVYKDEKSGGWRRREDIGIDENRGRFLDEEDVHDSFWDLRRELEKAKTGHGMGVAVDRLPSRRGRGQEMNRDTFGYRYQGRGELGYGGSDGTLLDASVSGLDTVEPVMREILSQSEDEMHEGREEAEELECEMF
ncbi:hypothetical protein B0T16DRAFT_398182 [Cercophora newfieldiana]|uniref:Uncharacterized protein n=1 Tax=Cercophora newfieldiana TaxID=92897 RepID=A0AA39YNZ4_9PEZI|nr:hypothetical protein B0T16DRAFT_398182 [Cercophora newfieldiana]